MNMKSIASKRLVRVVIASLLLPAGLLYGQATNAPVSASTNSAADALPDPFATAPAKNAKVKQPAGVPVPKTEKPNWMPQHDANVVTARKGGIDLLFVGDSLTKCWVREGRNEWNARFVPLHAADFGISGDCTQHVLWRLQNGELDGLQPKEVVLLIGTNNITMGNSPEEIAQAVSAIVAEIRKHLPATRILLLGILPRRESHAHNDRQTIRDINDRLSKLNDGNRVTYLDIGEKFLLPDGNMNKELTTDFCHLTPKGYEVFATAIQPAVDDLLKKP
jgi:lysophospholipase L1-like esterase